MKEYNIQLKVRNNYLFTRMREYGIETNAELSRVTGVSPSEVGHYLNLTSPPINSRGLIRPSAQKICDYFSCELMDLFPEQHLLDALPKNKAEVEVGYDEVRQIVNGTEPSIVIEAFETLTDLSKMLDKLTTRESVVLARRYGLDGENPETYKDIGKHLGVGVERIRQIEQKAIRKLRGHIARDGGAVLDYGREM